MAFVPARHIGVVTLLMLLVIQPALAAPAPFYLWQSRVSGKFICKQVSPGEGWVRFSGPFEDGGCRKALPPMK